MKTSSLQLPSLAGTLSIKSMLQSAPKHVIFILKIQKFSGEGAQPPPQIPPQREEGHLLPHPPQIQDDAQYAYSNTVRPSVCPSRSGIRWKRLNILGIEFYTKYLLTKSCLGEHSRCADIFGPDLTSRVVALCIGIAICHRRKFGQVWGIPSSSIRSRRKSPVPEGTPLDLRLPHGKIWIILRCNHWAVTWSPEGSFQGFVWGK